MWRITAKSGPPGAGGFPMKFTVRILVTALLVAAMASCGGDDDDGNGAATATPGKAGESPAATTGATAPATAKTGTSAKLPADACALLTADELKPVAPTAGQGKKQTPSAGPGQSIVACRWEWPEGVGSLDVEVSTLPAGTTAEIMKTSLLAEAKSSGKEVQGVGQFAIVVSPIAADVQVRALVNGLFLDIDLNQLGAREKQELLVTLAKAIAARIQ